MGACLSCLGRQEEPSQEDENSRLLYDDPHSNHYGSFGDQNSSTLQADPQDVQRESDALQKIVAQTSNHLVDIFAMAPQSLLRSPATNYSGQDARLLQYQDVLVKLSSESPANHIRNSHRDISQDVPDWTSDDDDEEAIKNFKIIRPKEIGPLLGGFADVENSIK